MTLYDLIMGKKFDRSDWAALGRGEITDEDTIGRMLAEGYETMVDADDK